MFIDKARIFLTAGRGGDGCISFRREKYVPLGGPDGGNGGRGGDIFLVASSNLKTLLELSFNPHYRAQNGQSGKSSKKFGRGAEDLIVKVPLGTIVFKDGHIIADLVKLGQKALAVKGGRGGRGNASFKTRNNTAPRVSEKGEPGEEFTLDLELKLIADIGLVGFPNAGKSTFLSRVSKAKPKIADYPFTTISPNLGVVTMGNTGFVIADIPGLIEGAHSGKGLGDEFLRHIERTKVLIHIIDIFGFNNKTPKENYKAINRELSKYSRSLAKKPVVLALNKTDLTGSDDIIKSLKKSFKGKKVIPISSVTGAGVDEALKEAVSLLGTVSPESIVFEEEKQYIYEPEFRVEKLENLFVVKGRKVENLASMTNLNEDESLRRFQNILKKMGVEQALKNQGISYGDMVKIGDIEFIFEK